MPETDSRELILCSATLLPDSTHPDPNALAYQVEATSVAGFAGISLWRLHADAAVEAMGSAEAVRECVLGSGLRVPIVEASTPWDEVDEAAAMASVEPFLALAESYRAQTLLAVTLLPELSGITPAARRLRALCERAADRGLDVAVEFLPWTGIPDLASAWQIVESAGCDNAGITIDAWHWQRQPGGPCPDLLRRIPPEFLSIFQICDAAAEPQGDPVTECMIDRRLPGEGAVDLVALVEIFDEIGANPLIAPEVFNVELAAQSAGEMARAIRLATERVFDRVGGRV